MNEKVNEHVSGDYYTGIQSFIDVERIETSLKRITEFKELAIRQLKKGVDYGVIPGSGKPTLLKPGAEKLLTCLELTSTFDIVDSYRDMEKNVFSYTVRCSILRGTRLITQGMGCCSSCEMEHGGQIASKGLKGEFPPDAAENFCLKIARKRALIDACLTATAMSETFTQDMEEAKTPDTIPEEPVQIPESIDKSAPPSDDDGLKKACDTVIDFGMHKGETLGQIYKKHPDYIVWLSQNAMDDCVREAAGVIAQNSNNNQAQA